MVIILNIDFLYLSFDVIIFGSLHHFYHVISKDEPRKTAVTYSLSHRHTHLNTGFLQKKNQMYH